MINLTLFSRSLKGLGYGNRFSVNLCVGFPHGWGGGSQKDARVNIADDPSTSVNNTVNFGQVTPEFCRRVCARRATRWALPRISSHETSDAPARRYRDERL